MQGPHPRDDDDAHRKPRRATTQTLPSKCTVKVVDATEMQFPTATYRFHS